MPEAPNLDQLEEVIDQLEAQAAEAVSDVRVNLEVVEAQLGDLDGAGSGLVTARVKRARDLVADAIVTLAGPRTPECQECGAELECPDCGPAGDEADAS
jgi:hypothetical protein